VVENLSAFQKGNGTTHALHHKEGTFKCTLLSLAPGIRI